MGLWGHEWGCGDMSGGVGTWVEGQGLWKKITKRLKFSKLVVLRTVSYY